MKQEDKELLLKDLSARLPFGVKCRDLVTKTDITVKGINALYSDDNPMIISIEGNADTYLVNIRPYLRPMNSITDEELEELHNLVCPNNADSSFDVDGYFTSKTDCNGHLMSYTFMVTVMDFLLRHNFDFRGLIEKGLALEEIKIKDKDNGIV